MPTPKKTATREDELTNAARRIAALEAQRRKKARELQATDDELRIARRTLRALAQQIAGVNDDVETPMPVIDTKAGE